MQIGGIDFSFLAGIMVLSSLFFYKLFAFYFLTHSAFYFFMAVFSFFGNRMPARLIPEKKFMPFFFPSVLPMPATMQHPAAHWP